MKHTENILTRRVEKVLPNKEGLTSLMKENKIRLYQGFDSTGSRLHLGHSVGIRKLMDFANAGHEVIFLFGTGTVLVGDPSQRDTGRKLITRDEIEKNIQGWRDQVSPLVDWDKVKILQNGDWLTKLKLEDIIHIASNISAVQLFKRDMFQRRLKRGDTVWYHETMYPLLQGYDSVVMDVDLEIGGTDQEFNMLIGRELQKKINNRDKYVLTTPMIVGTDGKQMSKTSGNCVWLNDEPKTMFEKLMKIADDQIVNYLEMVTNLPMDKVNEIENELKAETMAPVDAKKVLARTVVTELHSTSAAAQAQDYFEKTFQEGKPNFDQKKVTALDLQTIVAEGAQVSNSQAKRLVAQGSIRVNGTVVTNPKANLAGGEEVQIAKKAFIKPIKK